MSYQEQRSLTYLITNIILFTVYGLIIYNRYQAGQFDTDNLMRFWAIVILLYIPITIIARIVVTIVFVILHAIVSEVAGEGADEVNMVSDERDKLIEMKSSQIELILIGVGFVAALVTQLFGLSVHAFFLTFVGFMFATDVLSEIANLRYYRRGF